MGDVRAQAAGLTELFGVGEPRGMREAARGAMGAVWRLETGAAARSGSDGSSIGTAGVFAAKELFWFEGDLASVRREVAFRTACADAGVRSPMPLASISGEYVVQHEGVWWRLYEWVEGEVPDHSEVDVTTWLAEQMAVIQSLDWQGGAAAPVPFYHRVDADWLVLTEAAKRAQVEWTEALERVLPLLSELTSLVNSVPVGEQVWCHRDLKNTNVLRPRDTPSTVAEGNWLVDWDNVGPLAPERELGALLMKHLDKPDNLLRIVDAYRAAGGPAKIDTPAGFATGVAIHLNFLHGQANAAMDTDLAEAHRQYAAQQITGLITSLPTPETLKKAAEAIQQ